ncbi:MAG: outer membrane protein [Kofleriaceae bacterium]
MKKLQRTLPIAGLGIVITTSVAYAQAPGAPPPDPGDESAPTEPTPPADAVRDEVERQPWTAAIGIGFMELTGGTADDAVDVGLAYEVRGGYRMSDLLVLEGAYIGSSQSISALGLDNDATLRSNGVEAIARLDLDRWVHTDVGGLRIAPFGIAGLSFQRFSLANEGLNTSAVADGDNVYGIPLGAGVGATLGRFDADARFTWRTTYDEDLFREPGTGSNLDASLSHWSLTVRAGLAF